MPDDAIIGATYYDEVFDSEFEITSIEPEEKDSHDPEEIVLTMEYAALDLSIEVDLEQFREDESIEIVSVPE